MPLDAFQNTFAIRASYKRADADSAGRTSIADTLAMVLWNGKPMVEDAPLSGDRSLRIAYVSMAWPTRQPGGDDMLLGLWKETAVFRHRPQSCYRPAEGPLGLRRFEDLGGALRLPAGDAAPRRPRRVQ